MILSPSAGVRASLPVFLAALVLVTFPADRALARPAGDLAAASELSAVEVEPGDTLEGLLRELGLKDEVLVEVILGLSTEIDPDRLQPGQRLEIRWSNDGERHPDRVTLTLGDEVIELNTSGVHRSEAEMPDPSVDWAERAVSVRVEDTVIAALERAGAPSAIGLDLAAALGGLVDFSTEVRGGEAVKVLYREETVPEGATSGSAELRYAMVEIGGRTLEIVRRDENGAAMQVFEDGEPVRVSAIPVMGARVSSHFGRRKHPILGTVRMHSGVDFAAATGTPVFAGAPGTVSFVGTRGGYGRVVEIRHGADLMTRYAHLSSYADELEIGQHVAAGHRIGAVGSTGLATGPHLHYEVRYDGEPVDPLSDGHFAALSAAGSSAPAEKALRDLRNVLARTLAADRQV